MIFSKILVVECTSHCSNTCLRRRKSHRTAIISISNISNIVWCFQMVPESRFSKSYTHHETRINIRIKCGINPHIPITKRRSCISIQEVLLSVFFRISFETKSDLIITCISTFSIFFHNIINKLHLIDCWKEGIINVSNIKIPERINWLFILPYFKMKVWTSGRWSCSRSSRRSSDFCNHIALFHKLIWNHVNLRQMSVYRHKTISMFDSKICIGCGGTWRIDIIHISVSRSTNLRSLW